MSGGIATLYRFAALKDVWAEQGVDWDEVLEQRSRVARQMKRLGLFPGDGPPPLRLPGEQRASADDDGLAGWRLIEVHDPAGVRYVAARGRKVLGDRDLARLKHRLLEAI